MKKILSIALTLTLILALAVMPTSAASLSSNWTEVWCLVDGNGCGELVVANDGSIYFDSEIGGFGGAIGVAYNEKVAVDGLELHLAIENLFTGGETIWLPIVLNQLISVNLSADKATDFVPYNANSGDTVDETWVNPNAGFAAGFDTKCLSTAAVTFTLLDDAESYAIFGGMCSAIKIGYGEPVHAIKSGDEFILKFVVDGENVKILINGVETGVTFLAADVLDADGKAYLSIGNQGYGSAHAAVTLKYINGVAANEWAGEAGSCDPIPSEPAASEPEPSEPAPSEPQSSIIVTPPAEEKGGCGNKA